MSKSPLKHFLDFVELRTKLATLLPFFVALAYSFYLTGRIDIRSTLVYLVAATLLDMSVTAINSHYNARKENQPPHYKTFLSLSIIGIMLLVSMGLGLYLVYLHGITILFLGVFCFFIGVIYSFGPAPICKSPYGELFSGFTVGSVIMFIVVSINVPAFSPLELSFSLPDFRLGMDINLIELFSFGLITVPSFFSAANIMLANNICDREEDRPYRYTLVHSLGLEKSLLLFASLYYLSYIAIILSVILGLLSPFALLTLATFPLIQKNIRLFREKQIKRETFALSVKSFTVLMAAYCVSITLGAFFTKSVSQIAIACVTMNCYLVKSCLLGGTLIALG